MTGEEIRKLQRVLLTLPVSYQDSDNIQTVIAFLITALVYFEQPLLKKSTKARKATIFITETSHVKVTFTTENGEEQTKDPFCRFSNSQFTKHNYKKVFNYLRENLSEYNNFFKFDNENLSITIG